MNLDLVKNVRVRGHKVPWDFPVKIEDAAELVSNAGIVALDADIVEVHRRGWVLRVQIDVERDGSGFKRWSTGIGVFPDLVFVTVQGEGRSFGRETPADWVRLRQCDLRGSCRLETHSDRRLRECIVAVQVNAAPGRPEPVIEAVSAAGALAEMEDHDGGVQGAFMGLGRERQIEVGEFRRDQA